ncbi:hypothetical protein [Microbacterium marinilacus]|uniref:DUF7882 domain-containing protein n=1 Tax=Microbacterium marinilacus TaxID=415209 RepID=A0ABP7B2Z3_9MICO|nr:hypothetical protein [Microbacterium marinilacus]MBY0688640.1 hypothetical protein [Microbacterium marinilacus]
MGSFYYDGKETPITVDDRALSHLKAVMLTKLRRNESFAVSWADEKGHGRNTIWVNPAVPLRFIFDEPERPELDPSWLTKLAEEAAFGGMTFTAQQSG